MLLKKTSKMLALSALLLTITVPVSAATISGYFSGYKYTVTASKNGATAYGSIDYESTSSFTPAIAIWGTELGLSGAVVNYSTQWGTFSVSHRNSLGYGIVTVNAQGFINGSTVGIATAR